MINKTVLFLLIFALFSLTFATPLMAQGNQTKKEKQTEKVKEKIKHLGLGERVKIKVKLYNEVSYQGYVKEANEDDFVVVDKTGNPNTVKYSDVKSVGGKNHSTGTKIAIGVGFGIAAVIAAILLSIRIGNERF